ncbi:MAG: Nif11-like leader peptide family natural product precursor [Cyanobacteria bacterium J06560_6]
MSVDSLNKFVADKFLCDETIQNQLKATNSLDEFTHLMVSLGNELDYSFTLEEVEALVVKEINKQKKQSNKRTQEKIDDAMATDWEDGRFVEIGIQSLKNSDEILPFYP